MDILFLRLSSLSSSSRRRCSYCSSKWVFLLGRQVIGMPPFVGRRQNTADLMISERRGAAVGGVQHRDGMINPATHSTAVYECSLVSERGQIITNREFNTFWQFVKLPTLTLKMMFMTTQIDGSIFRLLSTQIGVDPTYTYVPAVLGNVFELHNCRNVPKWWTLSERWENHKSFNIL